MEISFDHGVDRYNIAHCEIHVGFQQITEHSATTTQMRPERIPDMHKWG